jgi:hypothetical protein
MILAYSKHFLRSYHKAPQEIQQAFDKRSMLLLQNLRHPSLRAKEVRRSRVTGAWRFYFKIVGDTYRMEEIKVHPK